MAAATKELVKSCASELEQESVKLDNVTKAMAVVQNFSGNIRTDVITKFEELLTSGVREVFGKDYKITIEFSSSANSYHADFMVTLPSGRKVNLATGEGGGLKDFIAVLQRMLYIMLEPNKPARILVMDENLKAVDVARADMAFRFIAGLAKELDIQVIMITHSSAAARASDGMSVVEIVGDGDITKAVKVVA
jgi:ABC-type molybdenum transport system ATPase subunit/photorepair protein PhrA